MALMSGVSVVTAGVSLQHGQGGFRPALSAAPTGAVTQATKGPAPSVLPATRRPAAPTSGRAKKVVTPPRESPTDGPATPARAAATRGPATVSTHAPAPSLAPAPTPSAASSVTVNGAPADTQYGPVQVQITVRSGRIVRADAIDYPQGGGRDQQINSQAIPQLDQETLNAQSAQVDTVSGATYTSAGYRQSLQSALDAAHRAGAR